MKRLGLFVILLMMTMAPHAFAQDEAEETGEVAVLFPGVLEGGSLSATNPNRLYVVYADVGDSIAATMFQTGGNVIPFLELSNGRGESLIQRSSIGDSDRVELEFDITETGWYLLDATSGPLPTGTELQGTYDLVLTGGSRRVFEEVNFDNPPLDVVGTLAIMGSRSYGGYAGHYLDFLLYLGETDNLFIRTNSGVTNTRFFFPNGLEPFQEQPTPNVEYTGTQRGWLVVRIQNNGAEPLNLEFAMTDADDEPVEWEPITISNLDSILDSGSTTSSVAAVPDSPSITCEVVAIADRLNVRNGPGFEYSIQGPLHYQNTRTAVAQFQDASNWTWWQLESGNWVREDGVSEEDTCEQLAIFVLEEEITVPDDIPRCILEPLNDSSLRIGPGTDFDRQRMFSVGTQDVGIGQYRPRGAEFRWWQILEGLWVREDGVTEDGECDELPVTYP